MRVLIVTDTIHAGGAETFVLRLADKLNRTGTPADILCLNPDIEDKELIDQYPGLTIHRVRLPLLIWIKRLDKLLRMAGIDFSLQYFLTGRVLAKATEGLLAAGALEGATGRIARAAERTPTLAAA